MPVLEPGAAEPATPLDDEEVGRALAVRTIGFVPAFDGVRAVAVLVIVIIHLTGTFDPSQRELFVPGGFLGVDLFFVLSGFLITSILLREFERSRRIRMGRFYLGRVLRLVPAVTAMFVVQYLWATSTSVPAGRDLAALFHAVVPVTLFGIHIFPLPGDNLVNHPPGLGQMWSLVVEELFYFVWPAIFFAVLTISRKRGVALGVTGLLIVVVVLHRLNDLQGGLAWPLEYARVDYRADSLLIGAFAAQLWCAGWVPSAKLIKAGAWAGVVVVGYGLLYLHESSLILYRGGYDVISVAVAFMLLALVETNWSPARLLSLAPLRAVGTVSYGFYVWHPLAFAIIAYYGARDGWGVWSQMLLGMSLAMSVTLLSWYLVERPFLLLKDHLRRAPTSSATNSGRGLPSVTSGAYR